jgi:dolichyl-phosphate beta-glucosyltransferase
VRYSILLPAYNEEATIAQAIRETQRVFSALQEPFEILVINDGSADKTASVVEIMTRELKEVRLIQLPENGGKGNAIQAGVAAAQGEVLLFLDCDLAVHPKEFLTFLPHLNETDILIGSRRVSGAKIVIRQPLYRVWLGQTFNFIVRRYLDIPFTDTQCGFKVFTKEAAQRVFSDLRSKGWVFDVEILLRAQQQGLRIKELPIEWRNGRDSRVRLSDARQILSELHLVRKQKSHR